MRPILIAGLAALVMTPAAVKAEDVFSDLLRAVEALERPQSPEEQARRAEAERERVAAAQEEERKRLAAAQAVGREPGKIGIGDSREYVRFQWGEPHRVDRSYYPNGTVEWWSYNSDNRVHFVDGQVYSIHQ